MASTGGMRLDLITKIPVHDRATAPLGRVLPSPSAPTNKQKSGRRPDVSNATVCLFSHHRQNHLVHALYSEKICIEEVPGLFERADQRITCIIDEGSDATSAVNDL